MEQPRLADVGARLELSGSTGLGPGCGAPPIDAPIRPRRWTSPPVPLRRVTGANIAWMLKVTPVFESTARLAKTIGPQGLPSDSRYERNSKSVSSGEAGEPFRRL